MGLIRTKSEKVKKESTGGFYSIAYRGFRPIGELILKIYPNLPVDLNKADVRVYPLAYASGIGMIIILVFLSSFGTILLLKTMFGGAVPKTIMLILLVIPIPVSIIALCMPKILKSNKIKALDNEAPFAAAYISVMSTGGISPYKSMKRLSKVPLLPNLAKVSKYITFNVSLFGIDPLTAIEKASDNIPSKVYAELLKGYVSTVRTGGDFVHYLLRKTELMFKERIGYLKIIGDRLGIAMEGYISATVLLGLGIYAIFITNAAIPMPMPMFTQGTFFLFSYVLSPMISVVFLYLGDMLQPSYPESNWKPYIAYAISMPIGAIVLVLSLLIPNFPLNILVRWLTSELNLGYGAIIPVTLGLVLIIFTLPAAIIHRKEESKKRIIEENLASFLRDLVEIRKAGLPPEKCISNLKKRDYKLFSPLVKRLSAQIEWGLPAKKILEDFFKNVNSWLAKMMMFLLIDAIDVGGGTPTTMESMASYTEMMNEVEKEKRQQMKPLLLVPYIGALVLVGSSIVLLGFMKGILEIARVGIAYEDFFRLFITPLVLNTYMMGLVSGKIGEAKVSAGFKHAVLLTLVTLIAILFVPSIRFQFAPVS